MTALSEHSSGASFRRTWTHLCCGTSAAEVIRGTGTWGEGAAFPHGYEAVFSSCSARSQSCSGEPSGQPRSAQNFSAKRAISSLEGAIVVCFLAAGLRRLAVPLGASALFVGIGISLICPSSLAYEHDRHRLMIRKERGELPADRLVTFGLRPAGSGSRSRAVKPLLAARNGIGQGNRRVG